MRKGLRACLLFILTLTIVSGCSSSSASKKEEKTDFEPVIESALQANQELIKEYEWNFGEDSLFDRKQSNIMIWEDENNYYVYFVKNIDSVVYGDGYKLSKNSDSWDSSPDDRATIKEFLEDNVPPIYEENNVELVSDDKDIR